jgi:hypothetical protein
LLTLTAIHNVARSKEYEIGQGSAGGSQGGYRGDEAPIEHEAGQGGLSMGQGKAALASSTQGIKGPAKFPTSSLICSLNTKE